MNDAIDDGGDSGIVYQRRDGDRGISKRLEGPFFRTPEKAILRRQYGSYYI